MHQIVIFVLGTTIGSFLNVVILRYLKKDKPAYRSGRPTGRSSCPHCDKQLVWWELIPLLSFIVLQGQCRHCHKPISVQYPLIELWFGVAALILFTPLPASLLEFLAAVLLLSIVAWLTILAVVDLYTMFLPDAFLVGLSVTTILLITLYFTSLDLISVVSGSAVGAGLLFLLWLITGKNGIGFGDVKLMLPLGALLGLKGTLLLLWLAFILGGIVAFWLLARGKAKLKTPIPFGPFLIIAAVLIILVPALPEYFFFFFFRPLN